MLPNKLGPVAGTPLHSPTRVKWPGPGLQLPRCQQPVFSTLEWSEDDAQTELHAPWLEMSKVIAGSCPRLH